MKKSMHKVKFINVLLLIVCICLYLLRSKPIITSKFYLFIWILICIFYLLRYGFYKDKAYFKKIGINYTLICCISYLIIIYLMGILLGFTRSIFNRTFVGIIKNIYEPLILLVCQIYVRNCECKIEQRLNINLICFTILCILSNVLLNATIYNFSDNELIFIFVCVYVLPIIAKEFLYTYLCLNVSFIPCYFIGFILDIFIYLMPIYPDLGYFLTSITSLFLPFIIFMVISKVVMYHEKKNYSFKKFSTIITTIPFLIFAVIVVILVSGLSKYKMISVVSNSMKNTFSRGDAVIYNQKIKIDNLKVGDIIVFVSNNKNVTHRIIKKYYEDGSIHFVTQGDANNASDMPINADDVLGKVESIVKYFGFPTIWFRESFNKSR